MALGRPVPGVGGRLGASAAGAKNQIVLMGGYVLDAQGDEITVPDVNVYIEERHWHRGKDIPVPVDRAVVGVTHDRFVYLIGGRSTNGPVNNVQVYDVEKDTWTSGHAFPRHTRLWPRRRRSRRDYRDRRWRQAGSGGRSALCSFRRMLAGQDR